MTDAAGATEAVRPGRISIGVAGGLGGPAITEIARVVEAEGFHALWVNDTPDGDALAGLAAAAAVTGRIGLATGVLPVDRRPADGILAEVERLGLPQDRLVLGIGSGQLRHGALERVGAAARTLRERTAARVVVGALGPRMRRLAASDADGALLSWLTPDAAARQATEAHALAPGARVALYARASVDAGGAARRDREAERYGAYPAYAANLARLGIVPRDTVLPLPGDADLVPGAAAYAGAVDELVLRAVPAADDATAHVAFVRAAASLLRTSSLLP
jgi:hypothetical protein